MAESSKHISIPKNVGTNDDLDYSFLRKKGLEHIEQLASHLWTDYNSHDPGITILEMLSYAITDLGARINLPIEDLLAPEDEKATPLNRQFFVAENILPTRPVTETDYRKLFIDIDGVKNCWLLPFEKTVFVDCKNEKLAYASDKLKTQTGSFQLQGLYSVIVDFDTPDEIKFPDDGAKKKEFNRIIGEITSLYHANRNLCEDLVEVKKVELHPIMVCAAMEIQPDVDEELIQAKVLRTIDNYFSPSIHFCSLKKMFENGYTSEEIFDGPVLKNGFIDPKELESSGLRTEVRLSDLIKVLMEIPGIIAIKDISMQDSLKDIPEKDVWMIPVLKGRKPARSFESVFSYFKGVLPVNMSKQRVEMHSAKLRNEETEAQEKARIDMEIEIPSGEFLNTGETTTIQNDFPETYGIGQVGLPSWADNERKAKARQLKGYLLFFDQILANYFAHLSKVKDLLSVDQQLKNTYFAQVVGDLKEFGEIVKDYDLSDNEILTNQLFDHIENNRARRNKILDHLISRFSERFSDYAFLMKQLYGNFAEQAVIDAKSEFLAEYGDIVEGGELVNKGIGNWRGSAFNYFRQPVENLWDTPNVAGAQKRIARLAGIKNYNRRNLSDSLAEFYDFLDSDNKQVYRWRIRNHANEIILSATQNYKNVRQAQNEMYLTVIKILETTEDIINKAFELLVTDEQEVGNFEIQISELGKYSFDVINTNAAPKSVNRIIARQFSYSSSQNELKESLLEIIRFLTTDFTEEGMFMVEHILLRPDVTQTDIPLNQFMPICSDDCNSCHPVDPYSYRLTVVLPGWTYRFANRDFRNFIEELIRTEIPAHILARICWIGYRNTEKAEPDNDMVRFEKRYKEFLLAKTDLGQAQNSKKLKAFIQLLGELNSIYPVGKLIDCSDETDALEGRIILGSTKLGNL